MLVEPPFEKGDGGVEVMSQDPKLVDVVAIFMTGEGVGKVVFRIDIKKHFAAVGAEEDKAIVPDIRRTRCK